MSDIVDDFDRSAQPEDLDSGIYITEPHRQTHNCIADLECQLEECKRMRDRYRAALMSFSQKTWIALLPQPVDDCATLFILGVDHCRTEVARIASKALEGK